MNQEIELRHFRYFLAVADTLHFTKAAEHLGIAQPALSQQIRKLESAIGHPLLERTTRGVKMTRAGQLLAERARSTLEKVNDDLERVRRQGRGEEGTLTIGFSGSVMFTGLPTAIEHYRRRYPAVELRLREMVTSAQIAALLDGAIDLGFLRDCDPTEGLQKSTLMKEPYIAALPAGRPLARKRSLRVNDLRDEPFILFARHVGPLAYDRTVRCCEKAGFRPNIVQDAPQWPTALRLVAAGLGVTLAPACVATLAMPGVVYRPIQSACHTTIDSAFRPGIERTLTENFLGIAREHLGANSA